MLVAGMPRLMVGLARASGTQGVLQGDLAGRQSGLCLKVVSKLACEAAACIWSHAAAPQVEYSWGATEVKASLPGVGAIVDITETGSSLRANNLRVC